MGSCNSYVTLRNLAREDLFWWMENWKICNGRKIQQWETHIIIQIDVSTRGCGGEEGGGGGGWSKKNNYFHINVLKLLALKFAILLSKRICQT